MDEKSKDFLVHYGVLGMKWGVRKKKETGNGNYNKSSDTEYYEKRSAKLAKKVAKANSSKKVKKIASKAAKANRMAKRSANLDKKVSKYTKNTSVGKSIAQSLLLGPNGSTHYARARALGKSKGKALVEAWLYSESTESSSYINYVYDKKKKTKKKK